ncbi:hypothetical protein F4818DRAFT_455098 [Hypoxylon cercidicola]|nr:hypothetical protein F4818DRAFT_455098 [Hypoxylon cercidicola]
MSTIGDVPNELLEKVVNLVADTSPGTLSSLALTSRVFYRLVRYRRYHTLSLLDNVLDRVDACNMWVAIRHLEIRARDKIPQLMDSYLEKMTGLRHVGFYVRDAGTVSFYSPNPIHLPALRQYTIFTRLSGAYYDDIRGNAFTLLVNGLRAHHRTHLRLVVELYVEYSQSFYLHLACNSPNLRSLEMFGSFTHWNTSAKDCRKGAQAFTGEYCGLGFVNGERPPPLESLELVAYPFGAGGPEIDEGHPYSEGYPLIGTEQKYWADNFDWSELKQCTTSDLTIFPKSLDKLASLKQIAIIESDPEDICGFLEGIRTTLESIHLTKLHSLSVRGIVKHGSQLRTLKIHSYSQGYKGDPTWTSPVDLSDLKRIRRDCPNIEDLTLDLHRQDDLLDTIATFPKLRNLSIFFELFSEIHDDQPPSDRNVPVSPHLTAITAKGLFEYLRRNWSIQPPLLKKLDVAVGSSLIAPMKSFLGPDNRKLWISNQSLAFTCCLSEREDEAARGCVAVSCKGLPKAENAIIQKALDTGTNPLTLLEYHPAYDEFYISSVSTMFKYAWNGPLTLDDWLRYYKESAPAHGVYFKGDCVDDVRERRRRDDQ